MYSGVGKSGSPAPNPITGRPAALRALAFASTASVADSAMPPMRVEIRSWTCGPEVDGGAAVAMPGILPQGGAARGGGLSLLLAGARAAAGTRAAGCRTLSCGTWTGSAQEVSRAGLGV